MALLPDDDVEEDDDDEKQAVSSKAERRAEERSRSEAAVEMERGTSLGSNNEEAGAALMSKNINSIQMSYLKS